MAGVLGKRKPPESSRIVKLNNGADVLVVRQSAEKFKLVVGFKVGANNDPREVPGLAHFVEHCVLLGSQLAVGPAGIFNHTQSIGGSFNGSTAQDITTYSFEGPDAELRATCQIAASGLSTPTLDPVDVQNEVKILEQEYQLNCRKREFVVGEVSRVSAADTQPESQFTLGNKKSFDSVQFELLPVVSAFISDHYVGSKMFILLLTSDVDTGCRIVVENFSAIKQGSQVSRAQRVLQDVFPDDKTRGIVHVQHTVKFVALTWTIGYNLINSRHDCISCITSIIESRHSGGMFDTLYKSGWISDIMISCSDNIDEYSADYVALIIILNLTGLGAENLFNVIGCIRAYLQALAMCGRQTMQTALEKYGEDDDDDDDETWDNDRIDQTVLNMVSYPPNMWTVKRDKRKGPVIQVMTTLLQYLSDKAPFVVTSCSSPCNAIHQTLQYTSLRFHHRVLTDSEKLKSSGNDIRHRFEVLPPSLTSVPSSPALNTQMVESKNGKRQEVIDGGMIVLLTSDNDTDDISLSIKWLEASRSSTPSLTRHLTYDIIAKYLEHSYNMADLSTKPELNIQPEQNGFVCTVNGSLQSVKVTFYKIINDLSAVSASSAAMFSMCKCRVKDSYEEQYLDPVFVAKSYAREDVEASLNDRYKAITDYQHHQFISDLNLLHRNMKLLLIAQGPVAFTDIQTWHLDYRHSLQLYVYIMNSKTSVKANRETLCYMPFMPLKKFDEKQAQPAVCVRIGVLKSTTIKEHLILWLIKDIVVNKAYNIIRFANKCCYQVSGCIVNSSKQSSDLFLSFQCSESYYRSANIQQYVQELIPSVTTECDRLSDKTFSILIEKVRKELSDESYLVKHMLESDEYDLEYPSKCKAQLSKLQKSDIASMSERIRDGIQSTTVYYEVTAKATSTKRVDEPDQLQRNKQVKQG